MAGLDYYKVLGISKSASADEIRKAYKKLARENHPDRNPGDEAAAQRFKDVQEAYSVLGDEEKRKQFDRFGHAFRGAGPQTGGGGWQTGPIDLGDLFGGGGAVDLGDLFGGAFGGGRGAGRRGAAPPRKGRDVETRIDVAFQIAAEGGNHELTVNVGGETERLTVKIPPGINDGSTIRLAGQGEPGLQGGPPGDLLVKIQVAPHPHFRREGRNLLVDVPITPWEAALGAKVDVPTLSEGTVTLTVPPGTSSGAKLRLREKGIADPKGGSRGDQLVVIKIVTPKDLTDRARILYEELAAEVPLSPREGLN